jgi:hypothetical protein
VAVDVDEVLAQFLVALNRFCLDEYGMKYDVSDYYEVRRGGRSLSLCFYKRRAAAAACSTSIVASPAPVSNPRPYA